jgi:hypothetical protein
MGLIRTAAAVVIATVVGAIVFLLARCACGDDHVRYKSDGGMDQISIKTTNPKCRLYWCFIEFIDWRYSQSCW